MATAVEALPAAVQATEAAGTGEQAALLGKERTCSTAAIDAAKAALAGPFASRTWSSAQRPPPSPFEDSPLQPSSQPPMPPADPGQVEAADKGEEAAGPSSAETGAGKATPADAGAEEVAPAEAVAAAEAGAAAANTRRSPRGLLPTKSAMKVRPGDDADPGEQVAATDGQGLKGLTWADTHGKAIHHVQEYQPSEHDSESFLKKNMGCGCCTQ